MVTARQVAVFWFVAGLGLAGCGGRTLPGASDEDRVSRVPGASGQVDTRAARSGTGDAVPEATKTPREVVTPSDTRSVTSEDAEAAGMYRVDLSHSCIEQGEVMTAAFSGPAHANLTMTVAYDAQGDMQPGPVNFATTDGAGRYDWRFPIASANRPGVATLLATGSGPNGEGQGGNVRVSFQVERIGGCQRR